ncbi:unnamed protein product, partial [Allacma fusca]
MLLTLKPDFVKLKFFLYFVSSVLLIVLLLAVLQAHDLNSIKIQELIRGPLKQ